MDVTGTSPEGRAEQVRELTQGRGADVIIEAAGQPEAFTEGLDLLARRGRYPISGLYSGDRTVEINPVTINNRSLRIIGNFAGDRNCYRDAVTLVPRLHRRFAIGNLVSDRFRLEDAENPLRSAGSSTTTKAVIVPVGA